MTEDPIIAGSADTASRNAHESSVWMVRKPLTRILLGNLGFALVLYISLLVLLPAQSARIGGPTHKTSVLAVTAGAGALVALVAAVGAGQLSDRLLAKSGSRRRALIAGAILTAVLLPALPVTDSVSTLVALWCFVQLGLNGVLSVVTAALVDWFDVGRRGVASAYAALGQVLGALVASGLVVAAGTHPLAVGLTGGAIFLVAVLPVGLVPVQGTNLTDLRTAVSVDQTVPVSHGSSASALPESSTPRPSTVPSAGAHEPSARSRTVRHPYADVALAWLVRLVVTFSNTLVVTYLNFYVVDTLRPADPQRLIGLAAGLTSLMVAVGALAAGRASDRSGRRRPFVMGSVVVMCAGESLLAGWHTVSGAFAAAVLVGLGYGVYLAVDQALSADVLPFEGLYGRDFGIMNTATSAPQVIAPPVAALLLGSAKDYTSLFAVGAVAALSAVGFVLPIKRVR
jgi:MFS family permease